MAGVDISQWKPGTSVGLGWHKIVIAGICRLQGAPVSHETENHTDTAGVVDAVSAYRIDEFESLKNYSFERTLGLKTDMTVENGVCPGMVNGPGIPHEFLGNNSIKFSVSHRQSWKIHSWMWEPFIGFWVSSQFEWGTQFKLCSPEGKNSKWSENLGKKQCISRKPWSVS